MARRAAGADSTPVDGQNAPLQPWGDVDPYWQSSNAGADSDDEVDFEDWEETFLENMSDDEDIAKKEASGMYEYEIDGARRG
ncbi:hypothetical protein PG994_001455 [Apiospora phragmitis]|uniref:Uncharacterized protein n=1 Tax=Apiospora phragmitis TaxID=2905665 RepID=A0ABR1WTI2_9PEZI